MPTSCWADVIELSEFMGGTSGHNFEGKARLGKVPHPFGFLCLKRRMKIITMKKKVKRSKQLFQRCGRRVFLPNRRNSYFRLADFPRHRNGAKICTCGKRWIMNFTFQRMISWYNPQMPSSLNPRLRKPDRPISPNSTTRCIGTLRLPNDHPPAPQAKTSHNRCSHGPSRASQGTCSLRDPRS